MADVLDWAASEGFAEVAETADKFPWHSAQEFRSRFNK